MTTTDDSFELVDGELIYRNGDCVVKIQEVSEVSISDIDVPEYTTTGNLIKIKNSDGQFVLLHEYPLKTTEQRQDVLKVIWDIVKPMDIGDFLYIAGKSAIDGKEPNANVLAFTHPETKKVYVNREPTINPKLSNKYKLINTIYHESLHHQDNDGLNSFMDHVDIYYQNAQHPSFEQMGAFPGSQRGTVENIAVRLLYHLKKANGFDLLDRISEVNDFINNFNNSSLKWSMRIELQPDGFSSNIYLKPDGFGEYSNAITIDTQKLKNYGD